MSYAWIVAAATTAAAVEQTAGVVEHSGECKNCGAPIDADQCSYCLTVHNHGRITYGVATLRPELLVQVSMR